MEDNRTLAKNTLSFSCSKTMEYLRCPKDIWEKLSKEFNFTIDICASDDNHLVDRYYTINNSALNHDWDNEVAFVHPLFDGKIGKFVEKASKHKGTFVFLLPASTHTRYFHQYFYKKPNVEIRFLEKPNRGFRFGRDDGHEPTEEELKETIGYIKPLMICIMINK